MANLSAAELAEMVRIEEESFNDVCTIRRSTGTTQDEYGEVEHTYVDIEEVPCGFSLPGNKIFKAEIGQAVVLTADALLRVSLEQAISINDIVLVRNKTYSVDGVHDGVTVRLATLKSLETSE